MISNIRFLEKTRSYKNYSPIARNSKFDLYLRLIQKVIKFRHNFLFKTSQKVLFQNKVQFLCSAGRQLMERAGRTTKSPVVASNHSTGRK